MRLLKNLYKIIFVLISFVMMSLRSFALGIMNGGDPVMSEPLSGFEIITIYVLLLSGVGVMVSLIVSFIRLAKCKKNSLKFNKVRKQLVVLLILLNCVFFGFLIGFHTW